MDAKCSACGAPLTGRKCDYCGTKMGKPSKTTNPIPRQSGPTPQKTEPANDFPTNEKRPRTGALLGIVALVAIAFAAFTFLPSSTNDDSDHDLIGEWDNGSGRIFLFVFGRADSVEFRDDGTVIITEGSSSQTVNWERGRPGHFTANNRDFTYRINGDVLTITDSANDDWTFDRTTGGGSANRPVDPPTPNNDFANHNLIGEWENGSGRIFLFGLGDPSSVEFRDDGTVIITGGRSAGVANWEPGVAGSFTINNTTLTYRISGDQLTITDSARDDWSFDRVGGRSPSRDNDRNNDGDNENSESALIGTWDWEVDSRFQLIFEADGTGEWLGVAESFNWSMTRNGDIRMHLEQGLATWSFEINGDELFIERSDGVDESYTYVRSR